MSFIAGIVRYDGLSIPESWILELEKGVGAPLRSCGSATGSVLLYTGNAAARCDADRVVLSAGPDVSADSLAFDEAQNLSASLEHGNIALASWSNTTRQLMLCRSHLGNHSIFYVVRNDVFAFASTVRALLTLPFVSPLLDEGTICRALCSDGSGPANDTYYAEVKRVPGGHCLTLAGNIVSLTPLPTPWGNGVAAHIHNEESSAETLRRLLIMSVESRLNAGKTIAVHLSGGLDSAAIACIAARLLKQQGRRLLALCSVLPENHVGPETDERRFIEAVLAQESTIDPIWITLPAETDPFGALPRWFDCLQEPQFSTVTHVEEVLGAIGREHGVDIVLSGFGGDFFASAHGVPPPELHFRRGRIGLALADLRKMHLVRGTAWWRLLRDNVVLPLARWCMSLRRPPANCATPTLIRRVFRREGRRPKSSVSNKVRLLPHQEMDSILLPGHLERVLPEMCQVFSECFEQDLSFPMLDTRIISFVRKLPEEELHRDGTPRSLMRRAMVDILPEVVRLRPDKGPAFDPALAAHCAATKPAMRHWANHMAADQCWDFVDRKRFLAALDSVVPSDRAGWQRQMFSIVLIGGRFAKFIDWHTRKHGARL